MTPPLTSNAGNHPGVSCVKSGKWVAKVRHPTRKILVCVGIYSTRQEAADAYNTKKLEYESTSVAASSCTNASEKHSGFKRVSSGKWAAKIRRNNLEVWLGTYDTPNEASDAYYMSKLELDSQVISCSAKACSAMTADVGQLKKKQRPCHAYLTRSGRWKAEIRHPLTKVNTHLGTFDTAEEAQEAFYYKRREFDLGKRPNNVRDADCVVPEEGCNNKTGEEKGEFGLGIIDSYGRLVGEYSRLDDELWICGSDNAMNVTNDM